MELQLNQTLASNLLLEVAYAGSKGTKLAERVNINQARLPDPTNITPIVQRRPFAGFGDILSANWQENSELQRIADTSGAAIFRRCKLSDRLHLVKSDRHCIEGQRRIVAPECVSFAR